MQHLPSLVLIAGPLSRLMRMSIVISLLGTPQPHAPTSQQRPNGAQTSPPKKCATRLDRTRLRLWTRTMPSQPGSRTAVCTILCTTRTIGMQGLVLASANQGRAAKNIQTSAARGGPRMRAKLRTLVARLCLTRRATAASGTTVVAKRTSTRSAPAAPTVPKATAAMLAPGTPVPRRL